MSESLNNVGCAIAVREGTKSYRYGYLDKVLAVTEGKSRITYGYHVDGQLATVTKGKVTEEFIWDGLALVKRGSTFYMNEPHPGGGAPVTSSDGGVMFNDILGTTLGVENAGGYAPSSMTAFGDTINCQLPTSSCQLPTKTSNLPPRPFQIHRDQAIPSDMKCASFRCGSLLPRR